MILINDSKVKGSIDSVKKATLEMIESYIGKVFSPEQLVPKEIMDMIVLVTREAHREIAVFLDRRGRVLEIAVGEATTVSLPEIEGRRSTTRLCGVRLLHSHPGGDVMPSSVDLNTLRKMRLDAMIVIGVTDIITGVTASILDRNATGELTEVRVLGPFSESKSHKLNSIFGILLENDKNAQDLITSLDEGPEKAIIVGVLLEKQRNNSDEDKALSELKELALTAGAIVVDTVVQNRRSPDPAFYIGKGIAEELSLKFQALDADIIIFDDELSSTQIKNLEEITGARVIDRTSLILDIFAKHAKSREGQLQIELAQQKYRLPRLVGMGLSMSKQGAGIGTRGPGETKLQSDRNHIKRRISYLEEQIEEVADRRGILRKDREKRQVPVIAIVGYTNAGKSTLMNKLCDSNVFVEDKLFATLDPTVRKLTTNEKKDFFIVDTVGFIKKLPHDLVEAFKSTLEEAVYADLLIHVVDASYHNIDERVEVVEEILGSIGAGEKPEFLVVNKMDKTDDSFDFKPASKYGKIFKVSAVTGEGIEELRAGIEEYFAKTARNFTAVIPYTEGWALRFIHENGHVSSEDYTSDGIVVVGSIPEESYSKIKEFVVSTTNFDDNSMDYIKEV